MGYHNHTDNIGDVFVGHGNCIEPLDSRWCGFYFDLGHAAVDLGENGWKVATNLVIPRLKMVSAKDFVLKQAAAHRWHAETCPMGQGIVPWRRFLHTLAQSNFQRAHLIAAGIFIPSVADDQGIAVSRAVVLRKVMASRERKSGLSEIATARILPRGLKVFIRGRSI